MDQYCTNVDNLVCLPNRRAGRLVSVLHLQTESVFSSIAHVVRAGLIVRAVY